MQGDFGWSGSHPLAKTLREPVENGEPCGVGEGVVGVCRDGRMPNMFS